MSEATVTREPDPAEEARATPNAQGPHATPRALSPVEVELKYRMSDAAAGDRVLAAEDLAGFTPVAPAVTVVHEDRYVDTAGGALAGAGWAARIRDSGRGTIISLKGLRSAEDGGALHRRNELEGPADGDAPPEAWPGSDARSQVLEIAGDEPLRELVTIRQARRRREYGRAGVRVELSVDDVQVVAGGRTIERFAELELELREGDEAELEPLAELLAGIEELVPAETSKLERALEAVRREAAETTLPGTVTAVRADIDDGVTPGVPEAPTTPRPAVPKSPGVLAEDHLAEAGRKVLRFHLARMLAREEGTRAGRENEDLHAMRVATRRQRAAWRVFGDGFDARQTSRHRRRLRAVARDLGGVRDLDVLIEAVEAYRDGQPSSEAAGMQRLIDSWRRSRDDARAVLIRELDSGRYRRWVEEYLAFTQTEGIGVLPVGPTQPHRVRDTMPSRIWAAYEQVRAYEPVLRWADVTGLHDLRIAAKWLRYTLEFVREALGRDAGPLIERVVALQDHLGWLHDADVAAGLARAYLVEHAGELSERESAAIGRYLVDRERELARLRRTVGPAWRGVSSLSYRRALGRVVAGL